MGWYLAVPARCLAGLPEQAALLAWALVGQDCPYLSLNTVGGCRRTGPKRPFG
jgi:hypothetical protein